VAKPDKPAEASPEPAPESQPSEPTRPTLAELLRAAEEGREVEISPAVSWCPEYVAGLYVDAAWRRYFVGTVKNLGESALDELASDPRILVRFV